VRRRRITPLEGEEKNPKARKKRETRVKRNGAKMESAKNREIFFPRQIIYVKANSM